MGSEARIVRRDWMRRADEIDGYLLEAFDLFTECSGAGITRSGGAVPTLPRCCSSSLRVPHRSILHVAVSVRAFIALIFLCSPKCACARKSATMGLIEGEILILAFGVVAKLVIVAAVGATAAKRPRDRVILSKEAITRISRLSAAVMCSASANCHTSRHRADVDDVGLTRSIQSRTGSRAS